MNQNINQILKVGDKVLLDDGQIKTVFMVYSSPNSKTCAVEYKNNFNGTISGDTILLDTIVEINGVLIKDLQQPKQVIYLKNESDFYINKAIVESFDKESNLIIAKSVDSGVKFSFNFVNKELIYLEAPVKNYYVGKFDIINSNVNGELLYLESKVFASVKQISNQSYGIIKDNNKDSNLILQGLDNIIEKYKQRRLDQQLFSAKIRKENLEYIFDDLIYNKKLYFKINNNNTSSEYEEYNTTIFGSHLFDYLESGELNLYKLFLNEGNILDKVKFEVRAVYDKRIEIKIDEKNFLNGICNEAKTINSEILNYFKDRFFHLFYYLLEGFEDFELEISLLINKDYLSNENKRLSVLDWCYNN